jgi:AcrR family transcriptional regulator
MTRREEILEAALESFDAAGATSIEEVHRRSGASVGSIYHHFGGKNGIAAALFADILRGYQGGVLRALDRAADAESGVKALVRHHLRWVERNPVRARFLLQGGGAWENDDRELRALNQTMFVAVGAWVERQQAIRPLRREIFYAVVFGPAQELSRSWLAGRTRGLRRLEGDLAETAWRAVRAE